MSEPKVVDFPGRDDGVRRHRAVLPREAMPDVDCAFCGSSRTEPTSVYSCNMMLSQYYCLECKSAFDWVRDD
jgi:hypothetical protein